MIIKLILCTILAIAFFLAFIRRNKTPLIAISVMMVSLVGIVFVIFPALTEVIAMKVGIGRGADLVTYLFISLMLLVCLDIYLRFHALIGMLATIVRHISLLEARLDGEHIEK